MGSKPSRPTRQSRNKQSGARLEDGRQDPYQHLSSDIPEERRALETERQKQKQHDRKSTYTRPLMTKMGTDGTLWFY